MVNKSGRLNRIKPVRGAFYQIQLLKSKIHSTKWYITSILRETLKILFVRVSSIMNIIIYENNVAICRLSVVFIVDCRYSDICMVVCSNQI